MANFCERCGTPLVAGSKFCERCGTPTGNVPVRQPVQAQAPQMIYQQVQPTVKAKKKSGGLKVVIALFIILAIGAGLLFASEKGWFHNEEVCGCEEVELVEDSTSKGPEATQNLLIPTEPGTEPVQNLVMGTGGAQGTYFAYGGVLANHIKGKTGITVDVLSTDGSKANIEGICDRAFQLAVVQNDIAAYAWGGENSFDFASQDFRVIGGLYTEPVQIITTDPTIKSVADLKGKRVAIGSAGSGVYYNAVDVLAAAGLTLDDIYAQYFSFGDSANLLKDGKIDAAFITAGVPTSAVVELGATTDTYIVPIDGETARNLIAANPYFSEYVIPAGTYSGQYSDVTTVTVKATLVVSATMSDEDVYNITKAIYDNIPEISRAHAKGAELSLENATSGIYVPFHNGAARYFAEKGIAVDVY